MNHKWYHLQINKNKNKDKKQDIEVVYRKWKKKIKTIIRTYT